MDKTPVSLLERMRKPGDEEAWRRFVELATPMLLGWAHRAGLPSQDAADLVQEVFAVLVRKLPEFNYDGQKSFRGWLRAVTLNKWRERMRRSMAAPLNAAGELEQLEVGDPAEAFWDRDYREYIVARALEVMRAEFEERTWKACWEQLVADRPASEVAEELGMTVGAVYAAKSRVLRRLREELAGLVD